MEQIDLNQPTIIALCGKSAAGKDSTAVDLQINLKKKYNKDCGVLVSATTRPPRIKEQEGIDYFFMSKTEFEDNIEDFICVSYFNGWYYGLYFDFSYDINIVVVNPQGLEDLTKVEGINLIPIYLKAPLFTRLKRAKKREKRFRLEFIRRAWTDWKDFKKFDIFFKSLPNSLIVDNSCGDGKLYPTSTAMIIGHLTRLNLLTGGQDSIS